MTREGPADREQEKSNTNTSDVFVCLYLREKADMKEDDKSAKQDEGCRKMDEETGSVCAGGTRQTGWGWGGGGQKQGRANGT